MTEASVLERILRHPLAALLASRRSDGPTVHAVGGIVRDAVLSAVTGDLDLSVAEQGASLAKQLADDSGGTSIPLGGDRFSSYRVVVGAAGTGGGVQADIWDRKGGSLRADLERRDLTINSIACAFDGTRLRDPFGGLSDLGTRTLRATKLDCFERDPLRVLRLVRFRLNLDGFKVEAATTTAARNAVKGLDRVAAERVRDELQRILSVTSTRLAFETLHELGALAVLVPEAGDPVVSGALLDQASRLDGCLSMLQAELSGAAAIAWQAADRRLAALSLLIGLSASDRSHAPGAPVSSGSDGDGDGGDLKRRSLATRKTLLRATRLLADRVPHDEESRRLFLSRHGSSWPLAFAVTAAARSRLDPSAAGSIAKDLEQTAVAHPSLVRGMVPLLNGHVAARLMGVEPGPMVGKALRALQRAQALGQVRSRDQAEDFVRKRRSAALSRANIEDNAELDATSQPPSGAD